METEITQVEQTQVTEESTRTFTQDDVNRIVSERLAKERSKYEGYDEYKSKAAELDALKESQKTELQKATERADQLAAELDALKTASQIKAVRDTVAEATGVPASLLTGSTEEECKAQAEAILKFAKPQDYPTVRDGGEVTQHITGKSRDKFAAWFNSL